MNKEFARLLLAGGLVGLGIEGAHAADLYFRSAPAIVRTFDPNVPSGADASQAEAVIRTWLSTAESLGDQGRLPEIPAATRDNPNLASAFQTRNRSRVAEAAKMKVGQIHFPVDAAIAGVSTGAVIVGGFLLRRT